MAANKSDLIEHVALYNAITKKEAKVIVESVFEFIMTQNENGEKVKIMGFGSFEPKTRPAYNGINPQDGTDIVIPQNILPKFRPGKDYRDRLSVTE